MYVARRAFRNYGQMILPGSVVEPGSIKWFKTRLKDRIIVEVAEHNFKQWHNYFLEKFGVDITPKPADEQVVAAPLEEPKPVKVSVKTVQKATPKA